MPVLPVVVLSGDGDGEERGGVAGGQARVLGGRGHLLVAHIPPGNKNNNISNFSYLNLSYYLSVGGGDPSTDEQSSLSFCPSRSVWFWGSPLTEGELGGPAMTQKRKKKM